MTQVKKQVDAIPVSSRFLIGMVSFLLFVALSEAALRLFYARDVRNDVEYYIARTFSREEWETASRIRDILLEIERRPFCIKDTILYRYRPVKTPYLVINSDGFRGPEVTPKQPGEYRIIITGASIGYGLYFPEEQTIAAIVEYRLRSVCPSCRITVYNLGIEGYDLQRDIAFADYLFDRIRPDLIVFYVGSADISYAYTWGYQRHEPFPHDGPFNEEQVRVLQTLYERKWVDYLRVTSLIARAVKSERGLLPEPVFFSEPFDNTLPPDLEEKARNFGRLFVADMERAVTLFREKNTDTLFVFMTDAVYKNPLSPLESSAMKILDTMYPHYGAFALTALKALREEVAARQFLFFRDFADIFDGVAEDIFYDFIHMTPRGNRMLAEKIFDLLVQEKVLEKAHAASIPNPSRPDQNLVP